MRQNLHDLQIFLPDLDVVISTMVFEGFNTHKTVWSGHYETAGCYLFTFAHVIDQVLIKSLDAIPLLELNLFQVLSESV